MNMQRVFNPTKILHSATYRYVLHGKPTLFAIGLFLLALATRTSAFAADDVPVELKPYSVLVSVSFDQNPLSTAKFRQQLLKRIENLADRTFSQMWKLDVQENRWLVAKSAVGLKRIDSLPSADKTKKAAYNKIILLSLEVSGSRSTFSGREWDAATNEWGPIETTTTNQRRALADAAIKLISGLFRPVVTIDKTEGYTVYIRLRAGVFPAADADATQLKPGDVIAPFLRYLDKKRVVQKIQFVPWTYLVVQKVERERVTCLLASGLRNPLGTSRRRRVETMGIRIRPTAGATNLTLVTLNEPKRPLAGFHVNVVPRTFLDDDSRGDALKLITNRRGQIRIPVDPTGPLVWIYVRSGKLLMARVPFAPGIKMSETIVMPDDSTRLAVEGKVSILKSELIDAVAARATLIARARIAAKNDDWENLKKREAELDNLPETAAFESKLTAIRVPAIEAAKNRKDRLGELRIRRLCDDASRLIQRFLDDDKIRAAKEEIDELRALGQQNN